MEQEFKYRLSEEQYNAIYRAHFECNDFHRIEMDARYLDTVTGFLRAYHIGLRMRREITDGKPEIMVCVKLPASEDQFGGALRHRLEYECVLNDFPDFQVTPIPSKVIEAVIAAGAPSELLRTALEKGLTDIARVIYTRYERLIQLENSEFTLCLDRGMSGKNQFIELEIEHKTGDFNITQNFAEDLAEKFELIPEPYSKLVRALQ